MATTIYRPGKVYENAISGAAAGKNTAAEKVQWRKCSTFEQNAETLKDAALKDLETLDKSLDELDLSEKDKMRLAKNIQNAFGQHLNILIAGATGCGKSTTILALFDEDKMSEADRQSLVVSGSGKPQTMDIRPYKVGKNLTIWDSPGLGDGEKDEQHIAKIRAKCRENDKSGRGLIDLGLVIIDGAVARDLESTYKVADVLVDELCKGEKSQARVVVAINKCDIASNNPAAKFNHEQNEPSEALKAELEAKMQDFKDRFAENKRAKFSIMYYAAGYYDEASGKQYPPYNLAKLLNFITKSAPSKKRFLFADKVSTKEKNFHANEKGKEWQKDTEKSWFDSVVETISEGIEVVGKAIDKVKEVGKKVLKAAPSIMSAGDTIIKAGKVAFKWLKNFF